jgi:uncharacterized protein YjaZ
LSAVPAQTVTVSLNDQRVRLNAYQKAFGYFVDIYVNDVLIVGGVLAHHFNRIVRSKYLGVTGDFYMFDTQGRNDPQWAGVGSRYLLIYDDAI